MTTTAETDHLQPFGYAPGNYMNKCADCKRDHIADKRARRCRDCAQMMFDEQPAAPSEIDTSVRERLARALCKAERPIVNPDKVVENWLPERDANGTISRLVYGPIREWHTRLPLVDAILAELVEPSEKLIMEGQHPPIVGDGFLPAQSMALRWQRMIQHIRDGGS